MKLSLLLDTGYIVGCMACGPHAYWTMVGSWRYTETIPDHISILVYTENLLRWKENIRPSVLKLLGKTSEQRSDTGISLYHHAASFSGELNTVPVKLLVIEPPRNFGIAEVLLSLLPDDKTALLQTLQRSRMAIGSAWPMNGYIYTVNGELYATDGTEVNGVNGTIGPLEFPCALMFLDLLGKTYIGARISKTWKDISTFPTFITAGE